MLPRGRRAPAQAQEEAGLEPARGPLLPHCPGAAGFPGSVPCPAALPDHGGVAPPSACCLPFRSPPAPSVLLPSPSLGLQEPRSCPLPPRVLGSSEVQVGRRGGAAVGAEALTEEPPRQWVAGSSRPGGAKRGPLGDGGWVCAGSRAGGGQSCPRAPGRGCLCASAGLPRPSSHSPAVKGLLTQGPRARPCSSWSLGFRSLPPQNYPPKSTASSRGNRAMPPSRAHKVRLPQPGRGSLCGLLQTATSPSLAVTTGD